MFFIPRTNLRLVGLLAMVVLVGAVQSHDATAAVYDPLGYIQHEWGQGSANYSIKWAMLGAMPTGVTNADVWDGVAVDLVNDKNPVDGNYYLKNTLGEYFNLYTDSGLTTPLIRNPAYSYYGGSNTGDLVGGHDQAVAGDTANPGDPRGSSSHPDFLFNPSHMWAPGSTNGSQSQNVTLEVKLPGSLLSGTLVELVDSFWAELNNQTYYVEATIADGGSRHLLWQDAAFTQAVLPTSDVGAYVTSLGGNGNLYWTGYLSSAINGHLVKPAQQEVVPEPSTLAIWSLLALCGIGYGWRRRRA